MCRLPDDRHGDRGWRVDPRVAAPWTGPPRDGPHAPAARSTARPLPRYLSLPRRLPGRARVGARAHETLGPAGGDVGSGSPRLGVAGALPGAGVGQPDLHMLPGANYYWWWRNGPTAAVSTRSSGGPATP